MIERDARGLHLLLGLSLSLAGAACDGSVSRTDGSTTGGANGASNGAGNGSATNGGTGETNGSASNGTASNGGTNASNGANNATNGGSNGASNAGNSGFVDAGPPPGCAGLGAPAIPKLGLEQVVEGLDLLVYAAQPPGSSDWYLVEQTGKVRVFAGGTLRSTPFLDLSSQVSQYNPDYDERGLMGLAFHPSYASNGKFYVMLTPTTGNENNSEPDRVLEYTRSAADPYVASTTSVEIVRIPSEAYNHNGGTVLFGPDGLLYVSTGDDGGACNATQPGAPQRIDNLFGKILRLDLSKPAPYAADGNPFAADGDARVLHYGLRNPFRIGFDRANGDLYIGDVGKDSFEEFSLAPAGSTGLNFGWAKFEGNANTCEGEGRELRPGSSHTPPFFAADRLGGSTPKFSEYASAIGGFVYRGTAIPSLQGTYLFGDYYASYMGAVTRCTSGVSDVTPVNKACMVGESAACFDSGNRPDLGILTGIVEGSDGEMYLVANRDRLYKVVP